MAVYQVIYSADNRKYIVITQATSENDAKKRMKKVFKEMEFDDAVIHSIKRIE